jgi:hypothetical protein
MTDAIIHFVFILAFGISAHGLMTSVASYRQKKWAKDSEFSSVASRIGSEYQIMAWLVLTLVLFVQVTRSFWIIFTTL